MPFVSSTIPRAAKEFPAEVTDEALGADVPLVAVSHRVRMVANSANSVALGAGGITGSISRV
jgi:hypothetical protein